MPKAATSPRNCDPLANRDVGLLDSFVDSQALLIIIKYLLSKVGAEGHTAHRRGVALAPSISSGIGLT